MPRIFVSHAAADKAVVSDFVDTVLRLGCDVAPDQIFYSSGADTGVPSGSDLNSYVRDQVSESDLVLSIITLQFQASSYCLAELGAAWSRAGSLFPLLGSSASPANLDGVLRGTLVRDFGNATALDELHDCVGELVGHTTRSTTWGTYRDSWLARARVYLSSSTAHVRGAVFSVSACSRGSDHMEVFWTDGSGSVFCRWWHEDSRWSEVDHWDDPAALHVAALSRDKGDELLFGIAPDGRVWMRAWRVDERGWMTAGDPEWLEGPVVGPLTAVSRAPWHIELMAWTLDGKQCHRWRHEDRWTAWSPQW